MRTIAIAGCLLTGCGGGGGDAPMGQANQFCYAFGSGGATCSGCAQVTNNQAAFDGSLASGATMGPGGAGTFTGSGGAQPAGRGAGVYIVLGSAPSSVSVSVSTLLGGVVQDTAGPSSTGSSGQTCNVQMDCLGNPPDVYIGLTSTRGFDGVRVTVNNSGSNPIDIRELCLR